MNQLLRWQVGAVRITRVQELEAPGMRFIVPQATLDNLAGIPWLAPFLVGGLLCHYWLDSRIWTARARRRASR